MASIATCVCLLTAPFDENRKLVHRFACFWGYHYLMTNPFWQCRFEGLEHIKKDATYVLVANHQSYWDIMVLYGLFRHFKWVSKSSIMKIPFIGWNMRINQYVSVEREDRNSIKSMMTACRRWLQRGSSIMIFPEGTRSDTGEIGAFRDGPFKLAFDAGVPVVPIVLDGTFDILPKNGQHLNFRANVIVKVLPPELPQSYEAVRAMREEVRSKMVSVFESIRSPGLRLPIQS